MLTEEKNRQLQLPFEPPLVDAFGGAQWIGLKADGSPLMSGSRLQDSIASYGDLGWMLKGGLGIGLVPASVERNGYRLVALDMPASVQAMKNLFDAYPPLAACNTGGGCHVWYWLEGPGLGKGVWRGPNGLKGQLICADGYAPLRGAELVDLNAAVANLENPAKFLFPHDLVASGGKRTGRGSRAAAKADARAKTNARNMIMKHVLNGVEPAPIEGATVGPDDDKRHAAMVAQVCRWGPIETWQWKDTPREKVDDDWIARRTAAYWLGMPDRQSNSHPFQVDEAAGILAWVLLKRHRDWLPSKNTPESFQVRSARGKRARAQRRPRCPYRGDKRQSANHCVPNEAARPWEDQGIDRATWYRRRAKERAAYEAWRNRQIMAALDQGIPETALRAKWKLSEGEMTEIIFSEQGFISF